jgi:cell division protein FtsQ
VFKGWEINPPLLPVISGLEWAEAELREGGRFPVLYGSLFESLAELGRNSPELLASVSEIQIDKKPWEGYELVVFPRSGRIKVRLGAHLDADTLRFMLLYLDVLSKTTDGVDEIDFRTGTAVYRVTKEASSE